MKATSRRLAPSRGLWTLTAILGLAVAATAMAAGPDDSAKAKTKAKKDVAAVAKTSYIDEMLQDSWKSSKVKSSPLSADAEFLRRVYLDLCGRIPNVQEATAFLEMKDSGKRAKLVEYLLAHPDFAKNFGNEWSIILVGRKPAGRDVDKGALSSWLRKQITANRPWNEMAYELITAKGSNKDNGAVNYPMSHLEDGAVNLTSFTTRIFLGQQIQCTQCHDHPSNNWKQADFWSINAFFKGVKSERVMKTDAVGAEVYDHTELSDEPSNAYSKYEKRNAVVGIAFPTYLDGTKISQNADVDRREVLGKFITEKDQKQLARAFVNRVWGRLFGRGIVHTVDDFGDHNKPSHPELLEKMAEDFIASKFDVKNLYRTIMASQAYQLTSAMLKENEKDETLFSHQSLKPMTPEQLFDSLLTATSAHKAAGGNFDQIRNQWLGQFTVTFANDEEGENSNFQGTIPQALMMMNGDLMSKATGGKAGSFLHDTLDKSRAQRKPALFIVNRLYLAALGRYPNSKELNNASAFLEMNPDSIGVLEDLFWSLLNCNEFVLNH
ncbi:MAG: Protein of unknown function (DUF1553)/Protein of unknown function [Planctomycetota bacterium]|nr:Protein of unknown function (DUF1553)/Protein of unknown function [Planctomycetota bacterium]